MKSWLGDLCDVMSRLQMGQVCQICSRRARHLRASSVVDKIYVDKKYIKVAQMRAWLSSQLGGAVALVADGVLPGLPCC